MKNRTLLPLMEQLLMIAVFALAAALCLQGFSLANRISKERQAKDTAVIMAQNAAEILKSVSGDFNKACDIYAGTASEANWYVSYDTEWSPLTAPEDEAYSLQAVLCETGSPLFGSATICIKEGSRVLYTLTVGWQEVPHETN